MRSVAGKMGYLIKPLILYEEMDRNKKLPEIVDLFYL